MYLYHSLIRVLLIDTPTTITLNKLKSGVFQTLAEVLAHLLHLDLNILPHQVVAHGHQTQTQQHVTEGNQQLRLITLEGVNIGAWHQITQAQLAQAGDAEVGAVQVAPLLPSGEHDGPGEHISSNHPKTGGGGYDYPFRWFSGVGFGAALVQPAVAPPEAPRHHLPHVQEVEHVQGYAEDGVDHGGHLARHRLGHHVPVPNHRYNTQGEHQGSGEGPHVLRFKVVAVPEDLHQLPLVTPQLLVRLLEEPVLLQDIVVVGHLEEVVQGHGSEASHHLHLIRFPLGRAFYVHKADGADERVAHQHRPHAHLRAHERHELPETVLDAFAGVALVAVGGGAAATRRAAVGPGTHRTGHGARRRLERWVVNIGTMWMGLFWEMRSVIWQRARRDPSRRECILIVLSEVE